MFDLRIHSRLLPKDVHGFFNFQLEACGRRVENQSSEQSRERQFSETLRYLKMFECLTEERCSRM